MADIKIIEAAAKVAFSDVDTNESAVRHDDHVAIVANIDGDATACIRIFWPNEFSQIRDKLHISTSEVLDELNNGPLVVSELAGEYDNNCVFSARERLVIRNLSADELSNFRDTFSDMTAYILGQEETFLPSVIALFKVETSLKLKSKSHFFAVSRSIFPRQNHEHLFFLDLKGCTTRSQDEGLFLKDEDVTWEHEMSFPQEEREDILKCLRNDVHFLQGLNLTNYSLIVSITKRHIQTSLQLPGQPYGPDDGKISDDNRATLPLRHDIPDGAKAIRADLIPKPRFSDEHPEWYHSVVYYCLRSD